MKKIIFALALLSFAGLGLVTLNQPSHELNIDKKIESIKSQKGQIEDNLEEEMDSLIQNHGIDNTLLLVRKVFADGLISADGCHGVLHTAGHLGYQYYPNNLEKLVTENADICIGSFYHGVEAQIAFSPNYSETLKSYCGELRKKFPGISCYHGAGHGFMEWTKNVEESLAKCDTLKDGPDNSVINCYRGIFSEYGSMALGYSGDSGERVPITVKVDMDNPYKLCDGLEKNYQNSCYTQLTKVILAGGNFNDTLKKCLNTEFREIVKYICVEIVSAVTARGLLSNSEVIQTPPIFASFSEKLKESYFIGMKDSFGGFNKDEVYRDWRKTCEQVGTKADNLNCAVTFENPQKTATW